jgi:hypothetical protein
MVALISFLLNLVASLFKSKSRLEAENAVLRHQLIVLPRKVRGRVQFTNSDRLFFIQLYRWFPSVLEGRDDHPARDPRALASCWFSALLALEVALRGRAASSISAVVPPRPRGEPQRPRTAWRPLLLPRAESFRAHSLY